MVYTAEQLASFVKESVEYYQRTAMFARELASKTHDEVVAEIKDDYAARNQELEEKLQYSYGSFNSMKEVKAWKDFCECHKNCWNGSKISSGRAFYIKPYGTGFGMGFVAVCPWCKKEKDITDTENW